MLAGFKRRNSPIRRGGDGCETEDQRKKFKNRIDQRVKMNRALSLVKETKNEGEEKRGGTDKGD